MDTEPFDIKVTIIENGSTDDVKMILRNLKLMFDQKENY